MTTRMDRAGGTGALRKPRSTEDGRSHPTRSNRDASSQSRSANSIPARSFLSRAIALLARRDHSRAELSRKLMRYAMDADNPAEIARVLDDLNRKGLLSDQRFAAGFARIRAQRFGDARIRHDLRRVGVTDDVS